MASALVWLSSPEPEGRTNCGPHRLRPGRWGRFAVLYQSAFSWGLFFAPLVALALTSYMGPQLAWRVLLGIGVLPLFVAIWAWFALPESARWLAERGRHQESD